MDVEDLPVFFTPENSEEAGRSQHYFDIDLERKAVYLFLEAEIVVIKYTKHSMITERIVWNARDIVEKFLEGQEDRIVQKMEELAVLFKF